MPSHVPTPMEALLAASRCRTQSLDLTDWPWPTTKGTRQRASRLQGLPDSQAVGTTHEERTEGSTQSPRVHGRSRWSDHKNASDDGRPAKQAPGMFISMWGSLEHLGTRKRCRTFGRTNGGSFYSHGAHCVSATIVASNPPTSHCANSLTARLSRSKTTGDDKEMAF